MVKQSRDRMEETGEMGREGAVLIGFAVLIGATLGMLLMALFKSRPVVTWRCASCAVESPPQNGDRRQLYLEVWDSYGRMLWKQAVGEGEMLDTRPVDAWITATVRGVVAAHNAASRTLRVVP